MDTIKELRTRNAENLAAKMQEVNDTRKLTRSVPTAKQIRGWIEAAGGIEPKITH